MLVVTRVQFDTRYSNFDTRSQPPSVRRRRLVTLISRFAVTVSSNGTAADGATRLLAGIDYGTADMQL